MFNFKEELSRYQPTFLYPKYKAENCRSKMQDLLDILQHIAKEKKQPPTQE